MGSSFIHLIRTDSNEFFLMAEYYLHFSDKETEVIELVSDKAQAWKCHFGPKAQALILSSVNFEWISFSSLFALLTQYICVCIFKDI